MKYKDFKNLSFDEYKKIEIKNTKPEIVDWITNKIESTKLEWNAVRKVCTHILDVVRDLYNDVGVDLNAIDLKEFFRIQKAIMGKRSLFPKGFFSKALSYEEDIDYDRLAELYHMLYEQIGKSELTILVSHIDPKNNVSIGKKLEALRSYKGGEYAILFEGFDNHVRNSIEHHDFEIRFKDKEIDFYDRNKKVTLGFKEFRGLCRQLLLLDLTLHFITPELAFNNLLRKDNLISEKQYIKVFL